MNPPPPPPPLRPQVSLHEFLQILRGPTTADQQERILHVLNRNPQLMTAFVRHRQQQQQQQGRQNAHIHVIHGPPIVQGLDVNTNFKVCSVETFNHDTPPLSTINSKRRRTDQQSRDDDGKDLTLNPEAIRLMNLNMNKVLGNPMLLSIILSYFNTSSLHGLRLVCAMWRDIITQILVRCNTLTFRYSPVTKKFLLAYQQRGTGSGHYPRVAEDEGGTPEGAKQLDDLTKFLSNRSHHQFPCIQYEFVGGNLGTRSVREFFSLATSNSSVTVPIKSLTLDASSFISPVHNVFTEISRLGALLQDEVPQLEKLCIKSLPLERWPEGSQLFFSHSHSLVQLKELEFGSMPWNQALLFPVMKELIEAAANLQSVTIHDIPSVLDNPESFQFFLSLASSSSPRPLNIRVNRIRYDPFLLTMDRLEKFAQLKPVIGDAHWPLFSTFSFNSSTREDQRRRLAAIWNILNYNKNHLTSASFSIGNLLWLLTNFSRRVPAGPVPIFAKLRKLHLTADNHITPPAPGNADPPPPPSPEESLLAASLCENRTNFAQIFPALQELRLSHLFEGRLWESYLEFVLIMPKTIRRLYLQDKFDPSSSSTILQRLQRQFTQVDTLVLCAVHSFPIIATSIWQFVGLKRLSIELHVEPSAFLLGNSDVAANLDAAFTGFSKDTVVGLLLTHTRIRILGGKESGGDAGPLNDEARNELNDLKENLSLLDLPNLRELRLFFRDEDTFQKPFYNVFSHLSFRHAFKLSPDLKVTLHVPENSFKNKRNAENLRAYFLQHMGLSQ